jgi:hypothetical protein
MLRLLTHEQMARHRGIMMLHVMLCNSCQPAEQVDVSELKPL